MRSRKNCLFLALVAALVGCEARGSECVEGRQVGCVCPNGSPGVQVCLEQGEWWSEERWGACSCEGQAAPLPPSASGPSGAGPSASDVGAAVGPGAGGFDPGDGDGDGDGGAPPTQSTPLVAGPGVLVALFASSDRIHIVLRDGIRVIDLEGEDLVPPWTSPREITSAAFDGEVLAVADLGVLHTFDANLVPRASVDLVQTCATLVVASGARIVCGAPDDWDRLFYTFDADGTMLGVSEPYTYHGIPMFRAPGTDDLITVTVGFSPTDFYLHELTDEGETAFVNESPYHGDVAMIDVLAFDGLPATHVITHQGVRLRIRGPGCEPGSSFESGCFIEDGVLGTLATGKAFIAMSSDDAGQYLHAIVDEGFPTHAREAGCRAQRIDLAEKLVVADVPLGLGVDARRPQMATIPGQPAFAVGANHGPAFEEPTGYQVDLLRF